MYARTFGAATQGVDGLIISVEVNGNFRKPKTTSFVGGTKFSSSVDITI